MHAVHTKSYISRRRDIVGSAEGNATDVLGRSRNINFKAVLLRYGFQDDITARHTHPRGQANLPIGRWKNLDRISGSSKRDG